MMKRLAFALLFLAAGGADAEELRPGAYEVAYRLELPHVEGGESARAQLCVAGAEASLPVLSANNPLAHCPARSVRTDGSRLTFEIVCPGGNAAKAQASFDLVADGFDGRIEMNMGGKNMTMTEVQHGRRVGDCAAVRPEAPASR